MNSDLTKEQLEELTETIKNSQPVPVSARMTQTGFDFIVKQSMIANKERYRAEHGIQIVGRKSVLSKYECRLIMSDNTSKIINLREKA